MSKLKLLVVYPEMMIGGSTTSLLAFLNCIDTDRYDVDLQLYKNRGPLMGDIPSSIHLLPEAFTCGGTVGSLVKKAKFLLSGECLRAKKENQKNGFDGYSPQVLADFQTKHLSRRSRKEYDIAIGFLEGWSDRYVASCTNAKKKIGWLHNTFANIAAIPYLERSWMERMDQLIFVADNCTEDFCRTMPDMAHKTATILNHIDSKLLLKRAEKEPTDDEAFLRMKNTDCFKIVTVCRMSTYHKGLDRAVWCAKKLKDSGRTFLWTIVGDGPDFASIQQMIREHDLSEHMVMIGNRLNPLPFIKEADVFCMPSRYEGKPMVITESMILGTPPFVTEYLSAKEQIQNGVDGVIADNGDDTMFPILNDYMEHPERIRQMKEYLQSHEYGNSSYMREIEEKYLYIGDNHE